MELYLTKPDLVYFDRYNEMMNEWLESGTQVAPWFLGKPFVSIGEFAEHVRMLDDCENGIVDKKYSSTTSYFVIDKNDRLIGAASLRHYLTTEGLNSWGHIGYGVRPSERKKGYATIILRLMLDEARRKKIYQVLIGVHDSNTGSWKTVEKCGGVLENTVRIDGDDEPIRRYWINNR